MVWMIHKPDKKNRKSGGGSKKKYFITEGCVYNTGRVMKNHYSANATYTNKKSTCKKCQMVELRSVEHFLASSYTNNKRLQ